MLVDTWRFRSQTANDQLEMVISKIEDRDLAGRVEKAFQGCICAGDEALLGALGRMAKSLTPEVREETVGLLGYLGAPQARQIVRAGFVDESPAVRQRALEGIGYACEKDALPEVKALISRERAKDVLEYARRIADRLEGRRGCTPLPSLGVGE